MCCHCQQVVQSTLSFKDFLPLLGTILTVGAGYFFLTAQVRKNRRAKWIEDFRRETGHLIWIMQDREYSGNLHNEHGPVFKRGEELIATAVLLQLFLNTRINTHKTLYNELFKINYENLEATQYLPNLVEIIKLVETILNEEQAKI